MILSLLRANQWYKNLVVFLPIIFAEALFTEGYLKISLFAFLSLCFASSAGYIINDLADAREDRRHPEKSRRPIAAGRVGIGSALSIALCLFVGSIAIAARLSYSFAICVLTLFALTQLYTFFLKRERFADVIAISTNFVMRAVAGAVVINVRVSPWLILCTFFLSMFLVAAKRKGNLSIAPSDYTPEMADRLMDFSTIALVMSYSLYTFLSIYPLLVVTLPAAIYVIFSYSQITSERKDIARNPEKILFKPKILSGILLWAALAILVIYLKPFTWAF